ncbi:MAG: AraC family transcriptional regulator ligand-binding domain-containing protein [Nevskiales bacterium]|nr:AraC family transcriptional regulator ligand-binding domain-containing protein [Nevskiales bacterium]
MPREPLHAEPIPFITLPNWVKAAALCGFNIEPVFARIGIETDLIHLEQATIDPQHLAQVMEACVGLSRRGHFPFVLGESFAFDYLPDIGTFLTTSPTLRDAMRVFDWVRELINPMIDFRLDESADAAQLTLMTPFPPGDLSRYFIEAIFAAVAHFTRVLTRDAHGIGGMRFSYPAPEYAAAYGAYFAAEVEFGQPFNALTMSREELCRPLPGAFPALHRQAELRVQQRLAQAPLLRQSGLVAALETALESHAELRQGGIDAMAAHVAMHPRALQRRLRQEGEVFSQLLDRVRYRLALRALQEPGLDLERLSERLGYSDRRSFTRAFTRWAGVSPSEFRKRRLDGIGPPSA